MTITTPNQGDYSTHGIPKDLKVLLNQKESSEEFPKSSLKELPLQHLEKLTEAPILIGSGIGTNPFEIQFRKMASRLCNWSEVLGQRIEKAFPTIPLC
ncbi:hypothetical protein Tco_0003245 [Tanacetum coccineum]